MTPPGPSPARWRRDGGVFLVSLVVLALQICLTKLFSVILWYHFGFLAISSALLGFSAAGVGLALLPGGLGAVRRVGEVTLAGGVATVLVYALLLRLHFDPLDIVTRAAGQGIVWNGGELLRFAAFVALLTLPFFAAGLVLSLVFSAAAHEAPRLYFASLLGSGAGCLLSLPLLDTVGGERAVPLLGAIFALASWGFRRGTLGPGMALLLGAAALAAPARFFPLPVPREKPLARVAAADRLGTVWTSLARVDFYRMRGEAKLDGLWGIALPPGVSRAAAAAQLPDRIGVLIDAWAMTSITRLVGEPEGNPALRFFERLPATLAYQLRRGRRPRVVALGAGGGLDVLAALYFGATHVTGVEINGAIVAAVRGRFAAFAGHLYERPDVRIVVAEGRHFLERCRETFDIVQVSGVDTYSSTQAGAYNLAENFLYTREAFACYFRRLAPDGILTLTRWYWPSPWSGLPRFSMRLFVLAWQALEDLGVRDPRRHLLFLQSGPFTVMLLKKEPFTPAELEQVAALADRYGYGFFHLPGRPPRLSRGYENAPRLREGLRQFQAFVRAPDRDAFVRNYYFDVSPPTDRRPFFFEIYRWRHVLHRESFVGEAGLTGHGVLVLVLAELVALATVFVLLPLFVLRRRTLRIPGGAPLLLYFAALGLGYMLIEIVLTQRFILFLGHPVYALSVVLAALLTAGGLGSLCAGRLGLRGGLSQGLALLGVLAVATAYLAGLEPFFARYLAAPFGIRLLLALGLLLPLGFLMGMPFPLGLRRLREEPTLVAWAWGVNGYFSVLGSVGSIVLGLMLGFHWVLGSALVAYGLALSVATRFGRGD